MGQKRPPSEEVEEEGRQQKWGGSRSGGSRSGGAAEVGRQQKWGAAEVGGSRSGEAAEVGRLEVRGQCAEARGHRFGSVEEKRWSEEVEAGRKVQAQ